MQCGGALAVGERPRPSGREFVFIICWLLAWALAWLGLHWQRAIGRDVPLHARRVSALALGPPIRCRKKPAWVLRQLVLLKAHLPDAGCRLLAITFNRVFAHRDVSISKSFVHRALRDQAYAVMQARKAIRSARLRGRAGQSDLGA